MSSALAADAINLINRIRAHARSQAAVWQQVPWLALQADGRSGFNGNLQLAYTSGYWAVDGSAAASSGQRVWVDLANGELVHAGNPYSPAGDDAVLLLATAPAELDAARLIEWLRKEAAEPIGPGYDPVKHQALLDAHIQDHIRRYKLTPRYVRRSAVARADSRLTHSRRRRRCHP